MDQKNGQYIEGLEIDTARGKRWRGLVGYVLLFLGVGALLVYLFLRFTGSMRLAVVLVGFMMTYMIIAGWLASRQPDDRDFG